MTLPEFIVEHENDELASLVLRRHLWPDVDVALAAECIASRRKLRLKVPEWYADPRILCPVSLSAEQCSSTATAAYKADITASVIAGLTGNPRIADLTGGLGVDCWQFSQRAEEVLYNEMNPLLCKAAEENFKLLGIGNVRISCSEIRPDNIAGLLDSFSPDLVFMDPARRGEGGRKVFRLQDCSPDVLGLKDAILDRCPLLLKLSPMADISLICKELGNVRDLWIVQTGGECKELLALLVPGFDGEVWVHLGIAGQAGNDGGVIPEPIGNLQFKYSEEQTAVPTFMTKSPQPGQQLFEPGPALSKSGAFKLISTRYGLRKLGPSTHLYISESASIPELKSLGKWFEIQEVAEFCKSAIKDFASRWPGASVTARALPLNSDDLRVKMKLRDTGDGHIFAVSTTAGRLLIATSRSIPVLR